MESVLSIWDRMVCSFFEKMEMNLVEFVNEALAALSAALWSKFVFFIIQIVQINRGLSLSRIGDEATGTCFSTA